MPYGFEQGVWDGFTQQKRNRLKTEWFNTYGTYDYSGRDYQTGRKVAPSGAAPGEPMAEPGAEPPYDPGPGWEPAYPAEPGEPPPPQPPTTPEQIDEFVRANYPQMGWALSHPELGNLLRTAAREMWSPARMQGALLKTSWYTTTAASEREWERLFAEDPAEGQKRFWEGMEQVGLMQDTLGVKDVLTDAQRYDLAVGIGRSGWTEDKLRFEMLKYVQYREGQGGTIGGLTDQYLGQARNDYFMPLTEQTAFEWAKKTLSGQADQMGFEVYLRDQAKSRWGTMIPQLDAGFTVRQIAEPYIQQTASLMEINPNVVDMLDPKWAAQLDFIDSNNERRMMTLAEAATQVRQDPEWRKTRQALDAATKMGQDILQLFGKVA